jgi:YhcH/YjgK/YiaL family protein
MAIYGTIQTCRKQLAGADGAARFEKALSFVEQVLSGSHPAAQTLRGLEAGKVERLDIDGDDVYAMLQYPSTRARADQKAEAHRAYADVQAVIDGDEILEVMPLDGLKPTMEFDPARDVCLYEMPERGSKLIMKPGLAAILYPEDGHAPLQAPDGTPKPSRRVVVKVRVS